mmetsp:Transcript_12579/g.15825  ORF Transcript_12579/g.15825 Transcript_12579/m.15825 type:complete len:630 (+) Transcript_12579:263-2152(+)|eukprot:CAMPEP_0172499110 /NCGR_PEP_ID=MMETSP1066-20121228/122191_1 /TAXON_ID=671091 /ORGANISM="Coscinodiscus wailesii, Strain CCMP2513" /LENGTH=629 /DNA_ID=CAMNT_0013272681 /DNA_START=257 /DNA_END=2146 /DNA_ORIENTATION=+
MPPSISFHRHPLLLTLLLLTGITTYVNADAITHKYTKDDHVELWVNKVGPYANPQEAYEYYTLPYCAPETEVTHNSPKAHSLGEILGGHSLRHSGHDLRFAGQKETEECTTVALTTTMTDKFRVAVEEQWFYQMYLDDLPVWGMVGEMLPPIEGGGGSGGGEEEELLPYLYTTRMLVISHNNGQIVKVDLTSDPASLKQLKAGDKYNFKMHVEWKETSEIPFHTRFDRYLDHAFFKHQIHWFSIFNSFMMVLFLTGLVALIFLRTLRKDYARYARQMSEEMALMEAEEGDGEKEKGERMESLTEDRGWKQVHGDVFRAPPLLPLFAASIGIGWQLIVLALFVILFAVAGPLHGDVYEERGEILHAILISYGVSSIIAGYASGSYYKRFAAQKHYNWQLVLGITILLLPTFCVSIVSVLNLISIWYDTINVIPFFAILKLFALWIFISVPLCIIGTLLGRHTRHQGNPCRVNAIPRPIPEGPWYGQPLYLIPLCGVLPFGSIFIELYYILTSLWNYKFYHVYGFMLMMYLILTIVVSMTSIISTYFCLNAENYYWHWNALLSGASMSGYVFLYGIYYFLVKTNMHGLLQTAFYFGYMTLISTGLGVLCGTLGYVSSAKFVRTIFRNVKVD